MPNASEILAQLKRLANQFSSIALVWHLLPKRATRSAHLSEERQRIDAFLAARRVALVGASTDASSFSRAVMNELTAHGMEVVPVHPGASEIAGKRAFPNVAAIEPAVEAALIMTPASASASVVEACAAAGITQVWLHRGAGQGAVSSEAIEAAANRGLSCVVGRCPLMFLGQRQAAVHRVHAAALRLAGDYPRRSPPRVRNARAACERSNHAVSDRA